MAVGPTTHPSLLVRLKDRRDGPAWVQFVDLYGPLIYGFARRRGLQDADAADLMQEVLRAVAGAVERFDYDPGKGTFRGWLRTVVCNKLRNWLRSHLREPRGSGNTATQEILKAVADPDAELQCIWDRQYESRLFAWAAEKVRTDFEDGTWQAFWRTAVEGLAVKDVAASLQISVGAVYIARSRVLARLRERVQEAELD